jgi:pimeloyl-ACP methyl ester carboxylesterase
MKVILSLVLLAASVLLTAACSARGLKPPAARAADLAAADGAILKASYFSAGKPGPGLLLLHQINRQRKAWDDLAARLAAAGINTLAFDMRGFGESGRPHGHLNAEVKSLMRQASQLPALFVVAGADEYPPTEETMEWLYGLSSNPGKKFVHYAGEEPSWKGYEDFTGVPATGNHGTDLFTTHPDLPGVIVDWCATTLIRTPGRAPVEEGRPAGAVADANDSLSDAYMADGQKDPARHYAGKALALLASDTVDSQERRNSRHRTEQTKATGRLWKT